MTQVRTVLLFMVLTGLFLNGCFHRDATRGLSPEELLARTVEKARSIENATIRGKLHAGQAELHYEGEVVYGEEGAAQKLLTFDLSSEERETSGVDIYITRERIFVRWPDTQEWSTLCCDSELAQGWRSIVEQTSMADPAYALQRIQEASREVSFVSQEEEEGRQFKVLRVAADLDQALRLFAGVLPPELPPTAYVDFHHTIWVARDTLRPYRLSLHVQLAGSTGELLPIHMECSFYKLNETELVLPAGLRGVLGESGGS